ncbi:MAG: hypothetical protein Kow0069_01070 [Promethearchaeota archaeon]
MEVAQISRVQLAKILALTKLVSEDALETICSSLYDLLLEKSERRLKNMLGRYIFHLKQVDRLNTTIGLQKLLEAGLSVLPEETLTLLETLGGTEKVSEAGKELAAEIREILA